MDAFFAAVEQHDNAALRGKPVLVGGSPRSRGVVAAASYEARAFGCHSAMPMRTAVRQCPDAVIVSPRFARYRDVSRQVMTIFRELTSLVEPLSLDEAFLDVSHLAAAGQEPEALARELKRAVRTTTGLTLSCGVATSKSVAKVASTRSKPDGLTVVPPGEERAFLAPLPAQELWGVGPKTAQRLAAAGVHSVGDLAARPAPWLIQRFGARGEWFHRLALGLDDSAVEVERETKSISSETTFAEDLAGASALAETLTQQIRTVARRLRRAGLRARTVQIKLRLADFTTFTRRRTLPASTDDTRDLERVALDLLCAETGRGRRFRLVGAGVSNFRRPERGDQLALFTSPDGTPLRATGTPLRETIAALRDRFGDASIDWADGDWADGDWANGD